MPIHLKSSIHFFPIHLKFKILSGWDKMQRDIFFNLHPFFDNLTSFIVKFIVQNEFPSRNIKHKVGHIIYNPSYIIYFQFVKLKINYIENVFTLFDLFDIFCRVRATILFLERCFFSADNMLVLFWSMKSKQESFFV